MRRSGLSTVKVLAAVMVSFMARIRLAPDSDEEGCCERLSKMRKVQANL